MPNTKVPPAPFIFTYNNESGKIEVRQGGQIKSFQTWDKPEPPTEEELADMGLSATEPSKFTKSTEITQRRKPTGKALEYWEASETCFERVSTPDLEYPELRLYMEPKAILQWQKSFASWKSGLRISEDSMLEKAECVSTKSVPRNQQTGEPPYLLIIPRKPQ